MNYSLQHYSFQGDIQKVRELLRTEDVDLDALAPVCFKGAIFTPNSGSKVLNDSQASFANAKVTAVYCAAYAGHSKIIELLAASNADVNKASDIIAYETPLSCAVHASNAAIVRTLLDSGASPDTPVKLWIQSSRDLPPGHDNTEEIQMTPLMLAAQLRNEAHAEIITALLIKAGADVNVDIDMRDALTLAAARGYATLVSTLLKGGAVDKDGSALGLASSLSHPDVVKLLLQANPAKVNAKPPAFMGSTPLILAADCGNIHIVRLLLKSGAAAEINHVNDHQFSAIHVAAKQGFESVVVELLDAGASATLADADGRLPHQLALKERHHKLSAILEITFEEQIAAAAAAAAAGGGGGSRRGEDRKCENPGCERTAAKDDSGKLRLCGGCKSVRYCSAECSKQDWRKHKHLCKALQQMKVP